MMEIEISTVFSSVAIGISMASLFMTKYLWKKTNRPIVTAFIEEDSSGIGSATLKLIVANSGNRPATNIRLIASENDISKLIDPSANQDRREMIIECFHESKAIPVLRNGEQLSTGFGAIFVNNNPESWLLYESQIDITIEYFDLEKHKYSSDLPLKIYAREGFGGTVWN